MDGTIRVKTAVWFATAVVLSVFSTLLVSQQWRADAAPGDEDSTYVPIANCRLFDFRSGTNNVGPKNTPLGAGESNVYIQNVHGANGACNIPSDAVGVAMNVTIVNPTAQSNLRVFPADIATPNASNLNWLPGQSPTPNKVDVKLSPDGKIKLYNHAGTVAVLADVVGYYTDKSLKELAATAGTTGPRGFSAWDTIPSGITVTGSVIWDTDIVRDNADHTINVSFPAKAPTALMQPTAVQFAPDAFAATNDDDATCLGSVAVPTAPPGKVCIYAQKLTRVDAVTGQHNVVDGADGFYIYLFADGTSGDMFLYFSWAYTAP